MIFGCVAVRLSGTWIEYTDFQAVLIILQNISGGASRSGKTQGS